MDAYSTSIWSTANPMADIEERMRAGAVTTAFACRNMERGAIARLLENVLRAGNRESSAFLRFGYCKERSIELLRMRRQAS